MKQKDKSKKIEKQIKTTKPGSPGRVLILFTVFLTGMAVMVLELMGSRVIGPFYGVSLYVWASLIATALVALALGYSVGGRLADRKMHPDFMYGFILLAALLTVMIPVLRRPVLQLCAPLGVRMGSLTSSILLFLLPIASLGVVSPYAVRLHAKALESVGSSAGNLYAISTIGSVVGTLLTGFILIPTLAMDKTLYAAGTILALLSVVYCILRKRLGFAATSATVILIAMILGQLTGSSASELRKMGVNLLFQKETPYGQLKIMDAGGARYMLFNGSFQGEVDLTTGVSTSGYIHLMAAACSEYSPHAKRVLNIGLGAGTLPTMLQRIGLTVDAVEIDGTIIDAARRFFSYDPGDGRVIKGDGRRYVESVDQTYDILFLDAFASESVPEHLLTLEAITRYKEILEPTGLFGINLVGFSEGDKSRVPRAVLRTVQRVFPHTVVWWIEQPNEPEPFGNMILLASESELAPIDLSGRIRDTEGVPEQASAGITLLPWQDPGPGPILTDQFNPVSAWNTATDLKIRKKLLQFLPAELLLS